MKLNFLCCAILSLAMHSCASLGSKTLYLDEDAQIPEKTRIIIAEPTVIKVNQPIEEVHEVLTLVVQKELAEFDFIIEQSETTLPEFGLLGSEGAASEITPMDGDYVLSAKIELLQAMGQTRDSKVEYKLVSAKTGKLLFHSKYNTTVGATRVIVPGISAYPNTDEIMLVGMSSGLHQFKHKLMRE